MPYRSFVLPRILVVLWEYPAVEDIEPILKEGDALIERLGRPLAFVSVASIIVQVPDRRALREFARNVPRLTRRFDYQYSVLEGDNVVHHLVRSTISFVRMLLPPQHRPLIFDSHKEALQDAASKVGGDPSQVLRQAETMGLLAQER